MKTFLLTLVLSLFTGSMSLAQSTHHHDHPSVHGMLMVGSSKIYASHLPMFHTPHDYQVILELKVSEPAKAAYLASVSQGDETVYTLVPETFVLPEMIENPKPFKAQIFKGHFERGGAMIAGNVTIEISKVIYFKKFSSAEVKPQNSKYILFGNKQEQFLAHSITSKPDFDQILKVEVDTTTLTSTKPYINIEFQSLPNSEPISQSGVLNAEIEDSNKKIGVLIQKNIYLETGDLSF